MEEEKSRAARITALLAGSEELIPAEELLSLVYDELRRVAHQRLARLPAGQTVQSTELVHEAWLRVVASGDPGWKGRAHFFGAAANAMRNILVDRARAKGTLKRDVQRKQELGDQDLPIETGVQVDDVLTLNEALERFEAEYPRAGKLVNLRFFVGCSMPEIAEILGLSLATAERDWRFARAWLQREIGQGF